MHDREVKSNFADVSFHQNSIKDHMYLFPNISHIYKDRKLRDVILVHSILVKCHPDVVESTRYLEHHLLSCRKCSGATSIDTFSSEEEEKNVFCSKSVKSVVLEQFLFSLSSFFRTLWPRFGVR